VFVAASTDCFPHLSLEGALVKLGDLEYSRVEIALREDGNQLKPSQIASDLEQAVRRCRDTHRLTPVAFSIELQPGAEGFKQFSACAKLAKATKVVSLTVRSSELGFPFNEEVNRLKELVRLAGLEGVLVSVKTEIGRLTQNPETAHSLCNYVKGLGITLDPSHFTHGTNAGANYEGLLPYVNHVQLRDTTKDQFQVRVGQGDIDYSRIISLLNRQRYQRALSVHIVQDESGEIDHDTEMRKMRLLLESWV